jgi:glycosyltransferase involved in cell wall biosynthesis
VPADSGVTEQLTRPGARVRVEAGDEARRRLRVCMVSYFFPPDYSGSAIQARNLARYLRPLGVEAAIVAANLRRGPKHEVVDGLPVYRLPVARTPDLRIPSFWLSLGWFLLRHRRDFDIIHAHGTLPHGSASIAGQLTGRPTILKVAMAESDIAFKRQGRLRGRLNRFMVRRFDRYVATTAAIAEEFGTEGLDTSRVRRIPNGVDTEMYSPLSGDAKADLRRRLGLPDGPLVTYVGILNKRKNVDGILRIWQTAVAAGAPGHLLLIGPGPEGGEFAQTLRTFLDAPALAGRVSVVGFQERASPFMQASDVFLFPSMQEGLPNVVLEAMACGLPCLVSASAGVDSIVTDGRNGFSRRWDDEAGFTAALLDLLASAERRQVVGAEARRTIVADFSLESVAARYRDLYDDMVAARTS